MNFRNQKKPDVDLNITPLIDVVFLLLIFFMVSTTFKRQSEIELTLPEASRQEVEKQPETVLVSIDRQGRVFVNEKQLLNMRLATIREALGEAAEDLSDPAVVISADAGATHQSVVRVMDAARRASLTKITFATRALEEE